MLIDGWGVDDGVDDEANRDDGFLVELLCERDERTMFLRFEGDGEDGDGMMDLKMMGLLMMVEVVIRCGIERG